MSSSNPRGRSRPLGARGPVRAGLRRVAPPGGRERGYVTAETAVVLPVLLVVLVLAVWVLAAVSAQLRCTDAAAMTARAAARGESTASAISTGRQVAPSGADLQVDLDGELVQVQVRAQVKPFGSLSGLPALSVHARAVAAREDVAPP